jgi:hypothetical protein
VAMPVQFDLRWLLSELPRPGPNAIMYLESMQNALHTGIVRDSLADVGAAIKSVEELVDYMIANGYFQA